MKINLPSLKSNPPTIEHKTNQPLPSMNPTQEEVNNPHQSQPSQQKTTDYGSDGSHIDELIGRAETDEQSEAHQRTSSSHMISADDFYKMFGGGFTFFGHMTKVEPFKMVENMPSSRPASDALYETILDIPALHFLLNPMRHSKWIGRAFVIGVFGNDLKKAVFEFKRAEYESQGVETPPSDTSTPNEDIPNLGGA